MLCVYTQIMRREDANTKLGRRIKTINRQDRKKQDRAKIFSHTIHDPESSVPT